MGFKEIVAKSNYKNLNFNNIDISIILSIMAEENKASVSQIRKIVDIAPNNLTTHLKKLAEMDLIKIKEFGIGKPKEISLNLEDTKQYCLIQGILDYYLLNGYEKEIIDMIEARKKSFKEIIENEQSTNQ